MTGLKSAIAGLLMAIMSAFALTPGNETAPATFWTYKTMTHAMGTHENNTYCNHEEALKSSIEKGQKLIEVDAILTTDGYLVMSHGWDKYSCTYNGIEYDASNVGDMPYHEFIGLKLYGKYHTMDAEDWLEYVVKYEDIFWEMDLRTLNKTQAKKTAEAIVATFAGKEECFERILIQVASEEMHQAMESVYEFPHYQYFTNKKTAWYMEDIVKYCRKNKIESVALPETYAYDYFISMIKEADLKILCYTVDDKERAIDLVNKGVDTICTNFLLEFDFY